MDADARRIRELEHGFRRDGLPNLMLRVVTGVAGFAGLYYAVTILVDSAYRDQFVDTLSQQLRDTLPTGRVVGPRRPDHLAAALAALSLDLSQPERDELASFFA